MRNAIMKVLNFSDIYELYFTSTVFKIKFTFIVIILVAVSSLLGPS